MVMMPKKAEPWWFRWKDDDDLDIADFRGMDLAALKDAVKRFEEDQYFGGWVGPVLPPKIFNRYSLEREHGSGGATTNEKMVLNNPGDSRFPGNWVLYDDVAEYDAWRYDDRSDGMSSSDQFSVYDPIKDMSPSDRKDIFDFAVERSKKP